MWPGVRYLCVDFSHVVLCPAAIGDQVVCVWCVCVWYVRCWPLWIHVVHRTHKHQIHPCRVCVCVCRPSVRPIEKQLPFRLLSMLMAGDFPPPGRPGTKRRADDFWANKSRRTHTCVTWIITDANAHARETRAKHFIVFAGFGDQTASETERERRQRIGHGGVICPEHARAHDTIFSRYYISKYLLCTAPGISILYCTLEWHTHKGCAYVCVLLLCTCVSNGKNRINRAQSVRGVCVARAFALIFCPAWIYFDWYNIGTALMCDKRMHIQVALVWMKSI